MIASICLSMIFSENRVSIFPDHALAGCLFDHDIVLALPAPNSAKNQTQLEQAIPGIQLVVVMARRMSSGTCRAPGQHEELQSAVSRQKRAPLAINRKSRSIERAVRAVPGRLISAIGDS